MAQQTLQSCCVSGHIHDGKPKGAVTKIAGMECYVAEPEGGKKDKTILFIPDVFGYNLPNVQILADEWADKGFYCYVPDFFDGDAVPHAILRKMLPTKPQQEEDLNKSLIEKAADTAAVGAAIGPFLVKHREAVAFPKIKEFLTHLRADPAHKKIGSVGFCWGGRYSILLAHAGAEPYVDGAVAFHPSFLSIPDEIEKIERPVDIEVGDQDALVKASDIETIQGIFHNKPQCHIEVHPDQVHGFSVRADLSIEKDKKAKEKGNENAMNFLNKALS